MPGLSPIAARRIAQVVVVGVAGVLLLSGWLSPLQHAIEEQRFALARRAPTGQVVLVDIDEASIHDVGVWPWNRSVHAALLDRLRALHAADIAFDVDFSSRSTPEADVAFEEALKRADGSVILAALQQPATLASGDVKILASHPLDRFLDNGWEGSVDVHPDPDGRIRWFSRGELFGQSFVPSLARLLQGGTPTAGDDFRIDFGIDAGQLDHVAVADVLHNRVDPRRIAGRKVIVGASAIELRDFFQTPRFGMMSGPAVQAMAVESLLQGRALQPVSLPVTLVTTVGLLGLLIVAGRKRSLLGALAWCAVGAVGTETVALGIQVLWPVIPVTAPIEVGLLGLAGVAVATDLVERRAKLRASRRNANRLRAMLDRVIADNFAGIVVVDQDGRVRAVSEAAAAILGLQFAVGLGATVRDVLPAPLAVLMDEAVRAARAGAPHSQSTCEVKFASAGSEVRTLDCVTRVSDVAAPAREGEPREFAVCLTFQDVTDQRRAQARLAEMAHTDALSGLANRYVFLTRLAARQARASDRVAAVLLLDLDRFKLINDRLGHAAGDALIQAVASRLRGLVAPGDLAARLGGDEFALLVERDTTAAIESLALTLVTELGGRYALGAYQASIRVSVGLALVMGSSSKEIMSRADTALYAAKTAGGDAARLYDDAMQALTEDGKQLEGDLREAVDRGEFEVVYQRQVSVADESIVGVEALVRWKHPVRGYIPPSRFIPVAERTGLIEPIGSFVLATACREAVEWPVPIKVSVNLSAVQLARIDLASTVLGALADARLAPERLDLELTESMLMENDEVIRGTIERLRARGVNVSLDDFGTGYSSLGYLKTFAIDKLKIDQSFVRDLVSDASSRAIVRAVVGLARDLGLRINAEGVETREQLAALQLLGCDEVQGYLHGRPEPSAAIAASLLTQRDALKLSRRLSA